MADEIIPGAETSESTTISKLSAYFKDAEEGSEDWRRRAVIAKKYYVGDQWSEADKAKLDSEGRPHLTLNQISPIINVVSGYQRQNRMDIKVLPRRGGSRPVADTLTQLAKHAQDSTNAAFHDSMMFTDGLITGKGWLGMDVDYSYDMVYGDLSIFRVSPFDMYEDPNAKEYDLNDSGRFISRCFWWSKDIVDLMYPDIVKETEAALLDLDPSGSDVMAKDTEEATYRENEQNERLNHKNDYRCKDFYWKTWEKRTVSIDTNTGQIMKVPDNRYLSALKKLVKLGRPIKLIDRVVPVLHRATMIGGILVNEKDDPFNGLTIFPFFRFTPYWVDGYIFGMVDGLLDPQNEVNKRRSQILHHLNSSANSGWMTEENSLTQDGKENLTDFGAMPGVNIEFKKGAEKPTRILPAPLSEGHLVLAKESEGDLKRVSGVNADMLGLPQEKRDSGVMIQLRQRQGQLSTEIVNDNYKYTKKIYGNALVEVIRMTGLYSEEEISGILTESKIPTDKQAYSNLGTGRYGVVISESPSSPTIRMANLAILLDAFKQGVPIPLDLIIEMSDLPNKEEIVSRIKEQMAAQQPNPAGGNRGGQPILPNQPGNPQPGGIAPGQPL